LGTSEVVRSAAGYLARHNVESPLPTAELLMMSVLGTDRTGIYAGNRELSTAEAKRFGRALCRRCLGTPTQHLTGEQGFRRLILEVRPGVFVPRPETEVLVEVALQLVDGLESPSIIDVGTGSGAIALAIKQERPDARVVATDVSPEAVALARANAGRLGLDVDVVEGDLLTSVPAHLRGAVDLVVSNPPYVSPEEHGELPPDARADPALALVGGIEVYERLFAEAAEWVGRRHGAVAVEIGASMGHAVADAAAMAGFAGPITIVLDLTGRPRVVRARKL
jgi:release factor glutamine methyltransferase